MLTSFNDPGIGELISVAAAEKQISDFRQSFQHLFPLGNGFMFEHLDLKKIVNGVGTLEVSVTTSIRADFYRFYLGLVTKQNVQNLSLLMVPVQAIDYNEPWDKIPGLNIHDNCWNNPGCKNVFSWRRDGDTVYKAYTTKEGSFKKQNDPGEYVLNVSLPCPPFGCDKDSRLFKASHPQ